MPAPDAVTIVGPASWSRRGPELAAALRLVVDRGLNLVPPTGGSNSSESAVVEDPSYWANHPQELLDGLGLGHGSTGGQPGTGVGVATGDRLTMTVEEAAQALGISRAFAYEAVQRHEIPAIHIGRRILVPRAALNRMLDTGGSSPVGDPS